MQPNFSIQDKIAIVTGASKGIGYGLAQALAAAGAKVAVMARSKASLDRLVEEISRAGGQAKAYELDVRNVEQIRSVFGQVAEDFGRLDIVVNNAGLGEGMLAEDITEDYWDEMMDVNLKGVFFCCQAAGRLMLEQGYGKIINVSSQVSVVGITEGAAYCASRAALTS